MYSAVLMLALTAGSETVDFGGRGCAAACNGVACSSACHGGRGCHGGGLFSRRGCHGCNGCTVSHGCSSACHGCQGGLFSRLRNRCHGCANACHTAVVCNGATTTTPKTMPKSSEPVPAPPKKTSQSAAPATIVVSLPADARLTVDGAPTTSTSERRTLITPNLEFGSTYVYTMRAEVVREGRTIAQTQQVNVTGGQSATVEFNFEQSVASR